MHCNLTCIGHVLVECLKSQKRKDMYFSTKRKHYKCAKKMEKVIAPLQTMGREVEI